MTGPERNRLTRVLGSGGSMRGKLDDKSIKSAKSEYVPNFLEDALKCLVKESII